MDRPRFMPLRRATFALSAAIAFAAFGQAADADATKPKTKSGRGVSDAALIAAAKSAMLSDISYGQSICGNDRTVEAWLNDVVGDTAEKIKWRGGACELTNDVNPMDGGSDWCGGATIWPKGHPKEPADIEIYFDKPTNGKPSKAYAFRGGNYDVDGFDYKRDWRSFEYGYRQKYRKDSAPPEPADCE